MKLRNKSNYPKVLEGTRFEPEEVKEVELDNEDLVSDDGSFEVVEEDNSSSDSDTEETSKPSKNNNKEGDE